MKNTWDRYHEYQAPSKIRWQVGPSDPGSVDRRTYSAFVHVRRLTALIAHPVIKSSDYAPFRSSKAGGQVRLGAVQLGEVARAPAASRYKKLPPLGGCGGGSRLETGAF